MADDNDNSTHRNDSADSLVRRLGTRYLFVLALVALLIVTDQAVIQPLLVRMDTFAPVINLAGRQRMLSQKLAKAALACKQSTTRRPEDRRAGAPGLAGRVDGRPRCLAAWRRQHGICDHPLAGHRRAWTELQPHFDAMQRRGQVVIDPADSTTRDRDRACGRPIVAHEAPFLATMDHIVNLMEEKAADETASAASVGVAIAAVVVLARGPGLVRRSSGDACDSRAGRPLGTRVAQRTRELDDALASLRHEIDEREEAESKNKLLAAQLAHADRVESMGQLAAGLAHELNQPLGAIANYAEACDVTLAAAPDSNGQRPAPRIPPPDAAGLAASRGNRPPHSQLRAAQSRSDVEVDVNVLVDEVVDFAATRSLGRG